MLRKEWTFIDRSAWREPSGPWDGEPDKVQWQDEATGLPCLAVRHETSGHWCGYVGVTPGHPSHGQDWDDNPTSGLRVHGGVTFGGGCDEDRREHGICHIPAEGEPDHVWWVGFDCAHGGDWSPGMRRGVWFGTADQYRTLAYVQAQCASLAEQLKQLGINDETYS